MTNKEKSELQKEVVDALEPNPHGRLLLAPRVGKGKIVIDVIKRDKPDSILWVTPSTKLAEEDIPMEFTKWKATRFTSRLTTCTYASLHNMEGHYDMIILDEDQHLTENNCVNLLSGCLSYNNILAMTGTSTKHHDKINLYTTLNLKTLYKININDAVDIGLLANYSIKVVCIDPIKEKMKKYNSIQYMIDQNLLGEAEISKDKTQLLITGRLKATLRLQKGESKFGGELFHVFGEISHIGYVAITEKGDLQGKLTKDGKKIQITKGIVHYPQPAYLLIGRSKAIGESDLKTEVASKLLKMEGRKLMFATSIDQCSKISSNVYHSKSSNESLIKFQKNEIDHVVMVNKGGTGYTYSKIDHLIVVQCDSDKNGLTSQKICRTLLSQVDYKATVWILCVVGTRDESWVESTLESFDRSKVEYLKN